MLFIQNSFKKTGVVMEYRDVGVEVKKWRMVMFMKNAHCVLVLTSPADNLCDHIYPPMGQGLVIQFARVSTGCLNNEDNLVP